MDETDWIARAAWRLHAQWPRIDHETLQELAQELRRDERLRSIEPERAVAQWLRQGVPVSA